MLSTCAMCGAACVCCLVCTVCVCVCVLLVVVDGVDRGRSERSQLGSWLADSPVAQSASRHRVSRHLHADRAALGDAHGRAGPVRLHAGRAGDDEAPSTDSTRLRRHA